MTTGLQDGDLLIVPQEGSLRLATELGALDAAPGEIAVVPRGIRFRVELEGPARGFACENYGAPFRLPELGPIGANGLASPRDFLAPAARYEEAEKPTEWVAKFAGHCDRVYALSGTGRHEQDLRDVLAVVVGRRRAAEYP